MTRRRYNQNGVASHNGFVAKAHSHSTAQHASEYTPPAWHPSRNRGFASRACVDGGGVEHMSHKRGARMLEWMRNHVARAHALRTRVIHDATSGRVRARLLTHRVPPNAAIIHASHA